MSNNSRFEAIIPILAFRPSKVVAYTKFIKGKKLHDAAIKNYDYIAKTHAVPDLFDEFKTYTTIEKMERREAEAAPEPTKRVVENNSTNFEISYKAMQNIRERINWLFQLSKPKKKMTSNGKAIHNFKMSFITLTLPSKQMHPTAEITAKCLNQFLIEMKKGNYFANYVWRLEFQKNGNVHYHIVTDTYVHWHHARNCWNRIINKLGYVQAYKEKFSPMSLQDYVLYTGASSRKAYEIAKRRYAVGCSESWENPNSIDVENIDSSANIAAYISKYVSKSKEGATPKNEKDTPESSKNIRLWFCSTSLSRLKSCQVPVENIDFNVIDFIKKNAKSLHVVHEYCELLYYTVHTLTNDCRTFLDRLFYEHSLKTNYIPSD